MNVQEMFDLKGKVAIITGGGRGIGKFIAYGMAEAGAHVVIASRKVANCEKVAQELAKLGVKTLALKCDTGSEEDITNLVEATMKEFGKIDILVNNAGITWGAPTLEFPLEPRVGVRVDGAELEASWCIVGNARSYGGRFHGTPGADPFTRGFEVVSLHRHGRCAVVPFFLAIPSGRHLALPDVKRRPALEVELTGEPAVPYQLDGDHAGFLPVRLRATDERVWVLVPTARESSSSSV